MVDFKGEPIKKAYAKELKKTPKRRMVAFAGMSENSFNKVLDGKRTLALPTIEKVADYFGLEVVVSFRRKSQ